MLKSYFQSKIAHFQNGQIAKHVAKWQEITSDPEVLGSVHGHHIEFSTEPQMFPAKPYQTTLSADLSVRIIINLERLNANVRYLHFKMSQFSQQSNC